MTEEERKEWAVFCKPAKHLTALIMNEQHKEILHILGSDKTFAEQEHCENLVEIGENYE